MRDLDLREGCGTTLRSGSAAEHAVAAELLRRLDRVVGRVVDRFGWDRCTEIDAIPPTMLREMVEQAIVGEIDVASWQRMKRVEELERASLENAVELFGRAEPGTQFELVRRWAPRWRST